MDICPFGIEGWKWYFDNSDTNPLTILINVIINYSIGEILVDSMDLST